MIYPDYKLREWAARNCGVVPYLEDHVNPASIDLCIGRKWIDVTTGDEHDTEVIVLYAPNNLRELWYKLCKIVGLKPKHKPTTILATTVEYVHMRDDTAGDVKLKSTMARSGLDHALAGWIDPGFMGQITLELHAHREVTLHAGQRICQLIVHGMDTPHMPYRGRYQNQSGPQGARNAI